MDGAAVVVGAGPVDGVRRGQPGEDGEAGDDGSGTADAAAAGNLDRAAGPRVAVQRADVPDGLLPVAGQQEVGPFDPHVRPVQLDLMTAAKTVGTQVDPEGRPGARRCRSPQTAAADPRAVGQFDRTGEP